MSEIPAVAAKERTKAKQRYLRRKKERRKLNKKAAPKHVQEKEVDDGDSSNEDSEDDEESGGEVDVTMEDAQEAEHLASPSKPSKPSKKRQKLEADVAENDMEVESPEFANPVEVTSIDVDPPAPLPALPRFPAPSMPNAPSKSVLALQGLDKALVGAEMVDPATTMPIEQNDAAMIGEKTVKRLAELGITELFAVQTALLPFMLPPDRCQRSLYQPYAPPRDACVSAPTGSGKTLAYVIPIIEVLSARIVTRLRALVVLPTRDLVAQVRETFEAVGKGRGLRIGAATGQHSFSHEQAQLVADRTSSLQGGSSKIDILICTPGRLIDHINETPNFSLQHLRFLVIDEADRLLAQSFQDWLVQVLAATRPPKLLSQPTRHTSLAYHDAIAPAYLQGQDQGDLFSVIERKESSCQKLLFSATLTRDPAKIAALELRDPKYFIVQSQAKDSVPGVLNVAMEKFTMPESLTEHMIVCDSAQKPLVFFHLVHQHGVTNSLVFTKSTESTARLVKLFEFFEQARGPSSKPIVMRAYSSDLGPGERKVILDQFKAQEIQILVCSDLISRGIDISHVSHVVSYDAPVDMLKYVHRVGRTARAGRAGDAWTLVEEQEARYFKAMLKGVDHMDKVKRMRIAEKDLERWQPYYEAALKQLKEVYMR